MTGERKKNLTGPASVLALEMTAYGLFVALLLVPTIWIIVAEAVFWGGVVFYLRRRPALSKRVRELFNAHRKTGWVGLAILVLITPFCMASSSYWLFLIITAGLFAIAALGLNLQLGSTGMVNLAGAAFYGIGAYAAALLARRWGWPTWLTIPVGAVVAGLFSILLFIPIFKTTGSYLALVTIAFQFIMIILLDNQEWTGGSQGLRNIPLFSIGGYSFATNLRIGPLELPFYTNFYYLLVLIAVLVIAVCHRLYQSWVGMTLSVIRDDEIAARTSGVDVARWKMTAFILGNCFIGLAGAFYSHLVGFIAPPNFSFDRSLSLVSIVILGGLDSVVGVIFGALLLTILPEKLRLLSDYRFLVYGIVLMVMLIFRPKGLFPFRVRSFAGLVRTVKGKGVIATGANPLSAGES
jgi:ABC-type branched-subunit amino acid transport system permease subunit